MFVQNSGVSPSRLRTLGPKPRAPIAFAGGAQTAALMSITRPGSRPAVARARAGSWMP
jgi:hypothetical protein